MRRIFLATLSIGAALSLHHSARAADTSAAPPPLPEATYDLYAAPQQLVALPDGRKMNVLCLGHGSPTIIFDAGGGNSNVAWARVQSQAAKKIALALTIMRASGLVTRE